MGKDNKQNKGAAKEENEEKKGAPGPKSEGSGKQGSEKKANKKKFKKSGKKGEGKDRTPGKDGSNPKPGTDDPKSSMKGKNGPEWYIADEQLVKDTCSLAFPKALGVIRKYLGYKRVGADPEEVFSPEYKSEVVIAAVQLIHSVPGTHANDSGVYVDNNGLNIAANRMYTYVRHANSGHSNYESADLMVYLIATSAIRAELKDAERAYKLAMFATMNNRAFPKALLESMGWDFAELSQNLADFRGKINQMIAQLGGLAVPDIFTLEDRWNYLNENIFMDEDNSKAQLYANTFKFLPTFDPTVEGGGALAFKALNRGSLSSYFKALQDAITVLVTDEDTNIMSGDILKAYGPEGIKKYGFIPEDGEPSVIHDEEYLHQIHNASIYDIPAEANELYIYQASNVLKLKAETYEMTGDSYEDIKVPTADSTRVLIDVHKDSPTAIDVLESTRLTAAYVLNDGDTKVLMTSGSEIVIAISLYYTTGSDSWSKEDIKSNLQYIGADIDENGVLTSVNNTLRFLHKISMYSEINMMPQIYWGVYTTATIVDGEETTDLTNAVVQATPMWNTVNTTEVTLNRLASINDQVALGMLIPAANRLTYVK